MKQYRREHVRDASSQVIDPISASAVGKIDDVQRLNTDRAAGAEVADNIKTFAENLDATMLFAGISLETAPLFSGENGHARSASLITRSPTPPITRNGSNSLPHSNVSFPSHSMRMACWNKTPTTCITGPTAQSHR